LGARHLSPVTTTSGVRRACRTLKRRVSCAVPGAGFRCRVPGLDPWGWYCGWGESRELRRSARPARPDEYADSPLRFLMNMRIHPGSHDDHEDRLVAGGTIGACVTEVTLARGEAPRRSAISATLSGVPRCAGVPPCPACRTVPAGRASGDVGSRCWPKAGSPSGVGLALLWFGCDMVGGGRWCLRLAGRARRVGVAA
jgi:hypothetical protein